MATKIDKVKVMPKPKKNETTVIPDKIIKCSGLGDCSTMDGEVYPHRWQHQNTWSDAVMEGVKEPYVVVYDQYYCSHCLTRVTIELTRRDLRKVADDALRSIKHTGNIQ